MHTQLAGTGRTFVFMAAGMIALSATRGGRAEARITLKLT
jgi:hypothetical protein